MVRSGLVAESLSEQARGMAMVDLGAAAAITVVVATTDAPALDDLLTAVDLRVAVMPMAEVTPAVAQDSTAAADFMAAGAVPAVEDVAE